MPLYYLGLVPFIIVILLFIIETPKDELLKLLMSILSGIFGIIMVLGLLWFGLNVFASTEMTTTVPLTPQNQYTTCIAECELLK